jgi:hypothetical protein
LCRRKDIRGCVEIKLHVLLTSALNGDYGSAARFGYFTRGKRRYLISRNLVGAHSQFRPFEIKKPLSLQVKSNDFYIV